MLPRYKDIVELMKKGSTLEAQEQIMSLREGAIELQEENQELKNTIRELENKLKIIDDWASERLRFSLVTPWRGAAQAYALNREQSNGEQAHLLCANCFHSSKKVILNPIKKVRTVSMVCPNCKANLETGYSAIGPAKFTEEYVVEG
jgi:hypothetical protein